MVVMLCFQGIDAILDPVFPIALRLRMGIVLDLLDPARNTFQDQSTHVVRVANQVCITQ